jgi:hypothetical protein
MYAFVLNFLKENNVPYHAIRLGKLRADIYFDDKARWQI